VAFIASSKMSVKRAYLNPRFHGSFSGMSGFTKSSRFRKSAKLKQKLLSIPAFALHHRRLRKFPRRFVYSPYINAQWQIDLLDVSRFAKENNDVHFILTVIDVFSKYAYLEPLKRKTQEDVTKAFAKILNRSRGKPEKVQCDMGKEFENSMFKSLLKKHNIQMFSTQSELKASIVERLNRTIMEKVQRYMTHWKTKKFVNRLGDFEKMYNNSFHRSIKTKPSEVNRNNQIEIHSRLYPPSKLQEKDSRKEKFKVGDRVLITKTKKIFDKGHARNFKKEIFIIHQIKTNTNPRTYTLHDSNNEEIVGGFYAEELLKINY
jgi:Integrase core domain